MGPDGRRGSGGGSLPEALREAAATAARPTGPLATPAEVIHSIFLRGKRPMAAPLSARKAARQAPAAGGGSALPGGDSGGGGALPSAAEAGAMSIEEGLGKERGRELGEVLSNGVDGSCPPLKRPRATQDPADSAEELRQVLAEAPAWRSVLNDRSPLGSVGTIGDWLKVQGSE
mmetsp:Transcript_57652/g.123999  ORF Transcript_57652/g.123999 Transcript_57652/m.123999 type:complete len:174 (+) Transcript_57652:88-609(+)